MRTVYLYIPELPGMRHFIAGDTHVINKAAPEDNVLHKIARKTERKPKTRKTEKMRAPLR